ncbi:MAG TPA: nucleotidyltransferase domain-containing protein [Granulicella sp.]|jgi:predicted nucleotidyltransferase|nr:nucleotidyltransferase domain-containing protein [Granulicella sp.]
MSRQPNALNPPPVVMEPHEWAIVTEILRDFAPGRTVWAYGSRATGRRVKRYSDLDLVMDGPPFAGLEEWKLEEAFDESRLPFKVEFQRLDGMSEEFRRRIEPDFVVVQAGS